MSRASKKLLPLYNEVAELEKNNWNLWRVDYGATATFSVFFFFSIYLTSSCKQEIDCISKVQYRLETISLFWARPHKDGINNCQSRRDHQPAKDCTSSRTWRPPISNLWCWQLLCEKAPSLAPYTRKQVIPGDSTSWRMHRWWLHHLRFLIPMRTEGAPFPPSKD